MTDAPYQNREIDDKFNDAVKEVQTLRRELLDKDTGILPKVLIQTTQHNGRLKKVETFLLIIGTATLVLGVSNPTLAKLLFGLLF